MFGRNAHHITHMLVRKLVHPLMENVLNNLISGKKNPHNTISLSVEVDSL